MVRIKIKNEINSGKRSGWTKHVTNVDMTKTNGYAFEGEFIPGGKEIELPVGAILIQKNPEGSVKNGWWEAEVFRLSEDGTLIDLAPDTKYDWKDDFLSFRDLVAEALEQEPPNPLAEFSDLELIEELERRGITVD